MTDINTPEQTLEESQALMTYTRHDESGYAHYRFDHEGAESEPFPAAIAISTAAWLEFGRPDEITVSVQPGNHLDTRGHSSVSFVERVGRIFGGLVGAAVMLIIVGAVAAGAMGLLLALRYLAEALTGS